MIILPAGASDPDNPRIGWRNLVTPGNVIASSEEATAPALNLGNPATFQVWRALAGGQNIDVNLGAPKNIDYVALARHNFGAAGIGYTLQGCNDNASWVNLDGPVTIANDDVILHQFSPATVQYVRLALGAGAVPAQLAVLFVGTITVLQRRIYVGHKPINFARQTTVSTGMSESGQFLGRVSRRKLYATQVSVSNLTPEWYRAELEPFADVSAERPFFWAWRPEGYPQEAAYAWVTDDPVVSNARSNGMMQFEMSLQGIVR